MAESKPTMKYVGMMAGHRGWVTAMSTAPELPDLVVSASRDKKVIAWRLGVGEADQYGTARTALTGHIQAIQDVVLSNDGLFALSGSWDKTMRLWDLNHGCSARTFVGHESDVLSVAFSGDNRQIVSASRDKTIKLWNTLGECKYTIEDDQHTDWISCVRFTPLLDRAEDNKYMIVSCGWDKLVKVWSLSGWKLNTNLAGHLGPLYTVTIAPDGSLCASGGKDGSAMLWDIHEGKHLYSLDAGSSINALCFSPQNYWLCAATDKSIKIWDLESKGVMVELLPETPMGKTGLPWCVSLCWSASGNTLFAGCTDGIIYVYETSKQ